MVAREVAVVAKKLLTRGLSRLVSLCVAVVFGCFVTAIAWTTYSIGHQGFWKSNHQLTAR